MRIKSILHESKYIPIYEEIDDEILNINKNGVKFYVSDIITCSRCKSKEMYLAKNGNEDICMCSNYDCLRINSEANKSERTREMANRNEKNQGVIVTGAMKFGMGEQFHHASLNKWNGNKHETTVSKWINNDSPFLVYMGNKGTGKSYMCGALLNRLFDSREEVHYVSHSMYNQSIQNAIHANMPQHSAIDKIAYKKYLVFDDLGATSCNEWQKEMLLDLIDRRHSNNKKTVFTTNLDEKDLKSILGERSASRLLDMRNTIIDNWGPDRRQDPNYIDY